MRCISCGRSREDLSPATAAFRRRTCNQCAVAIALNEKVRLQEERAKRLIVEEAKRKLKEEEK